MMLKPSLVEVFVIEGAEFRRQATKRSDEPELRGDAIDNENELDIGRERQATFSLTLHLVQRVAGREKVRIQDVAAVCGISEITDPVPGVEAATRERFSSPSSSPTLLT